MGRVSTLARMCRVTKAIVDGGGTPVFFLPEERNKRPHGGVSREIKTAQKLLSRENLT